MSDGKPPGQAGKENRYRQWSCPIRGPEDLLSEEFLARLSPENRTEMAEMQPIDAELTWMLLEHLVPDYQPRLFPMGELWVWVRKS